MKQRQKFMHLDKPSTLLSIEAPVVVKPDIHSNIAFVSDGISPLKKNGIQPVMVSSIQLRAVTTNPSFAKKRSFFGRFLVRRKPIIK
jgi:hypothetical protein